MVRILVTGSTTGIGLETARTLQGLGHDVVWHARSKERAADLGSDAEVVVGDLASLQQTRELAGAAGHCDVVIHNAGINWENERRETGDGIERIFQVNVLAPYVLTALVARPQGASPTLRICSTAPSRGTVGRRTATRSCMTWPLRGPSPGGGQMCTATPSIRAGSARGSAGRTRLTICRSAPTPRCGWPPALAGPWSPGGISNGAGSSAPTQRPVTSGTRTGYCARAPTSPRSNCRCDRYDDGPPRRSGPSRQTASGPLAAGGGQGRRQRNTR